MVYPRLLSVPRALVFNATLLVAGLMLVQFDCGANAGQSTPGELGLNLANPTYWSGERSLMNLMAGGEWQSSRQNQSGWTAFDPARLDANGNVAALEPGEVANAMLVPPERAYGPKSVRVRCKWEGSGTVQPGGSVQGFAAGTNSFAFNWQAAMDAKPKGVWVSVTKTDKTDPIRRIDCREADADENAVFSTEFISFLADFKVLRYLDWQNANANATVRWASRTRPESQFQASSQGMAVEYLVALANQMGADPWFTMPWNADEDYIRRFAEHVRDNLDPRRKVYVELSNEVWNYIFPATAQAEKEGLEAKLSGDRFQAALFRYAEKSAWMLKIWTEIFVQNPERLVRVVATQHGQTWAAEQILGFHDTARYVDALATAPYFGHAALEDARAGIKSLDDHFAFLEADIDRTIQNAVEVKKTADQYGKRYIAYEAGQHIFSATNIEMVAALNRDQRMHALYAKYLQSWQRQMGDLMVMFNSTGSISQYGAWGVREYTGQPIEQTPKRRAILEFLKR